MGPLLAVWLLILLASEFVLSLDESHIVYPRLLESRNEDGAKVLKLSDDLVLHLEPSSVFSDVFVVRTFQDGRPHESYHTGESFEKGLYHDTSKEASVMLTERDDLLVEGILGRGLRIRPLEGRQQFLDGQLGHEVYKVQEKGSREDVSSFNIVEERQYNSYGSKNMMPDVHFIVQYDHAKAFNFNETSIIQYLAVTLNVVNLRYRAFNQPRIRMRVAGVTINKKKEDEPYVTPHYEFPGFMDTQETMGKMRANANLRWLQYYTDIIMLISSLNLAQGYDIGATYENVGYTYVGGACTDFMYSIVEDVPLTYSAVHIITHQIAHQLGCSDDELLPDPHIPGHPGSLNCSYKAGYIMSWIANDANHYKFSNCCVAQIRHFFTLPDRSCLHYNTSNYIMKRSRFLPGDLVNASDFCKRVHAFQHPGAFLDQGYSRRSCKLRCIAPRRRDLPHRPPRTYIHYAVEGASCDDSNSRMVCMSGNCVDRSRWDNYVNPKKTRTQ